MTRTRRDGPHSNPSFPSSWAAVNNGALSPPPSVLHTCIHPYMTPHNPTTSPSPQPNPIGPAPAILQPAIPAFAPFVIFLFLSFFYSLGCVGPRFTPTVPPSLFVSSHSFPNHAWPCSQNSSVMAPFLSPPTGPPPSEPSVLARRVIANGLARQGRSAEVCPAHVRYMLHDP